MSVFESTLPPARLVGRLVGRPTLRLVAVIIRARLRGFKNALSNTKAGRLKLGLTIVAGLIVALVIGFMVNRFSEGILALSPELIAEIESSGTEFDMDLEPRQLIDLVPRAVLALSLVILFFSTFASLLGALYLSDDMPRLLTAPVPARAVFLAKFLEAAFQPTAVLFAFGLPPIIGYGIAIGAGALFHVLAVFVFLLLPPVALGLSALATLALVRVLPARRANEVLRVLGALMGLGVYFGTNTLMQGDESSNLLRGLSRAPGLLGADGGAMIAHPWAWPAESVIAAGAGRPLAAMGWGFAFAVLAMCIVAVSVLVSERLYLDGWAKAEGDGASKRRRTSAVDPSSSNASLTAWRAAARRSPTLAIVRKDLLLIRRDIRGWSMLIWPVAIGVFWLWQASGARGDELLDSGPTVVRAAAIATALFAAGGVGQRFAIEGISRDAASVRIAIGAPITGQEFVAGKVLVAFLLSLAASVLLLGAFALIVDLNVGTALLDGTIVAIALAAQSAIGVAAGAIRPTFDWTDPQKIVGGGIGCATWLAVFASSMVLVGVGLGPSIAASLLGAPAWLGAFGPLGALALTTAVIFGCVSWAGEKVDRIEL